jgi:hypothetical protein
MVRNNLELACDSLFIEKIKKAFKATEPFIHQDADAFTVASDLPPPHLWKNRDEVDEIHKNFDLKIANSKRDLKSHSVLRINSEHYRRINIRTVLKLHMEISVCVV